MEKKAVAALLISAMCFGQFHGIVPDTAKAAEQAGAIRNENAGMVQLGNETNGGFCGETNWDLIPRILNAGAREVRTPKNICIISLFCLYYKQ